MEANPSLRDEYHQQQHEGFYGDFHRRDENAKVHFFSIRSKPGNRQVFAISMYANTTAIITEYAHIGTRLSWLLNGTETVIKWPE